jgi:hypothetical protein
LIDDGVLIDHEDVIEGDHIILDFFQAEIHGVLQDLDLLRSVAVLLVVVQTEDGSQVLGSEDDLVVVVAKPVVQHVGDGSDKDEEEQLKESDEWGTVVTNGHFVLSCCVGLG